jgi:hypothetical protein
MLAVAQYCKRQHISVPSATHLIERGVKHVQVAKNKNGILRIIKELDVEYIGQQNEYIPAQLDEEILDGYVFTHDLRVTSTPLIIYHESYIRNYSYIYI